jgi:hypothetical protein
MKRALQIAILFCVAVSAVALCGLAWIYLGYGLGEAFNSAGLFKTPENFAAERELHLWSLYMLVAISSTIGLLVTYRRNYKPKAKIGKFQWPYSGRPPLDLPQPKR